MTNDTIKIEGFVEIRNGDTVIKAKNRFVQTLLQHVLNFLSCTSAPAPLNTQRGPMQAVNMYVGTDTTTPTVYNTTVLTSQIGIAPGTPPTTIGGTTQNPSNGVFRIIITATWNAGSLPGNPTIGEMALYMTVFPSGTLRSFAWVDSGTPPAILASRLAVADGTFSAFTINSANPLSIVWTIQLSFV